MRIHGDIHLRAGNTCPYSAIVWAMACLLFLISSAETLRATKMATRPLTIVYTALSPQTKIVISQHGRILSEKIAFTSEPISIDLSPTITEELYITTYKNIGNQNWNADGVLKLAPLGNADASNPITIFVRSTPHMIQISNRAS